MFGLTGEERRMLRQSDPRRPVSWNLLIAVMLMACVSLRCALAETADVLPKGVWNIQGKGYFYWPIEERFGPKGDEEPLAIDFNGQLDSTVFPALAPLDPFVVGGQATIGESVVDFELDYTILEFDFRYGVTEKLSLELKVTYWEAKNTVDATLDSTSANVGKNPLYNPAGPFPINAPLVPLGTGVGETPLTNEDVQNLLGQGLDVNGDSTVDIAGFGYERLQTWSESGFGDTQIGGKYKFHDKDAWRLAVAAGVRLPTGRTDDPDNLADVPFGTGSVAGLLRFYADYRIAKNWIFNATLFADIFLQHKEEKRVPSSVNEPLTSKKTNVKIRPGSIFEVDLQTMYQTESGWYGFLAYRGGIKGKDRVSGPAGFDYSSLEDETDLISHIGKVGVGFSSLGLYAQKKFPLPMYAELQYRNRFAGENVFKSEYIGLTLGVFF